MPFFPMSNIDCPKGRVRSSDVGDIGVICVICVEEDYNGDFDGVWVVRKGSVCVPVSQSLSSSSVLRLQRCLVLR